MAPPGNAAAVRPLQRHVDVEPARGRPRRAAAQAAPRLVADDDQVGADDHGLSTCSTGPNTQPAGDLPPGRGHVRPPNRPPIRASSTTTASTTGWPSICGDRQPGRVCTALPGVFAIDPSDLNVAVDRDRRPRRCADGHATVTERRASGDLQRARDRHGRLHAVVDAVVADARIRARRSRSP